MPIFFQKQFLACKSNPHWKKLIYKKTTMAQSYKTFFVLNSVEHEILNAGKYKNIKKISIFQAHISLES